MPKKTVTLLAVLLLAITFLPNMAFAQAPPWDVPAFSFTDYFQWACTQVGPIFGYSGCPSVSISSPTQTIATSQPTAQQCYCQTMEGCGLLSVSTCEGSGRGRCSYTGCPAQTTISTTTTVYPTYGVAYAYTPTSQQYGNLNVHVTQCGCSNPISGAYVTVNCAADPSGYTDGNGYAYFSNLPIGTCSVTASASGYGSQTTTASIQCSQTTNVNICLGSYVTTTTIPWTTTTVCGGCGCGGCGCTAGYTGAYQCFDNDLKQQYKNSDCSYTWITQQHCNYGCSGNSCQTQQCIEGYKDSYRCDGNWLQRLYQYNNCNVDWVNIEFQSGTCGINRNVCGVSASVTTPSDIYTGDTASSTITLFNYGDGRGYINVNAHLCRDDGSQCSSMSCSPSSMYVDGRYSSYVTCSKTVDDDGYYKIKVNYDGCNADPTVYSGTFNVKDRYQCSPRALETYQCFGDDLKQQYQSADCSKAWQLVKHCSYGCEGDECKEKTTSIPLVSLKKSYDVKPCEINSFTFDVINVGNAKSTINVVATGDAADWLKFLKTVDVEASDKAAVKAYASVPCDASDADFTITASTGTEQSSASSQLHIVKPAANWFTGSLALPVLPYRAIGIALLLLIIAALIVLFLLWLLKGKRHRGCGAERFGNSGC